MTSRIGLLSILLCLFACPPAFAKDKPDKDAKEREARKACLAGDYAKGVEILSELFLDSKDPTHIFNQGRCYEQSERYEEALGRFREYLRTSSAHLSADDKELARQHIAECEDLLKKKNAVAAESPSQSAAPPSTESPKPQSAATSVAPESPKPIATVSPEDQAPQPVPGAVLRMSGLIVGSVGVASLVAGLALNLKANSVADSITPPNSYDRGTDSTRKTYVTFSEVGYAVGAVGIAAGAVLYGLGWSQRKDGGVALVPVAGPGLAGAMLTRSF